MSGRWQPPITTKCMLRIRYPSSPTLSGGNILTVRMWWGRMDNDQSSATSHLQARKRVMDCWRNWPMQVSTDIRTTSPICILAVFGCDRIRWRRMVLYRHPQQHKLSMVYELRKVNLPAWNLNIDALGVYVLQCRNSRRIDNSHC